MLRGFEPHAQNPDSIQKYDFPARQPSKLIQNNCFQRSNTQNKHFDGACVGNLPKWLLPLFFRGEASQITAHTMQYCRARSEKIYQITSSIHGNIEQSHSLPPHHIMLLQIVSRYFGMMRESNRRKIFEGLPITQLSSTTGKQPQIEIRGGCKFNFDRGTEF